MNAAVSKLDMLNTIELGGFCGFFWGVENVMLLIGVCNFNNEYIYTYIYIHY